MPFDPVTIPQLQPLAKQFTDSLNDIASDLESQFPEKKSCLKRLKQVTDEFVDYKDLLFGTLPSLQPSLQTSTFSSENHVYLISKAKTIKYLHVDNLYELKNEAVSQLWSDLIKKVDQFFKQKQLQLPVDLCKGMISSYYKWKNELNECLHTCGLAPKSKGIPVKGWDQLLHS